MRSSSERRTTHLRWPAREALSWPRATQWRTVAGFTRSSSAISARVSQGSSDTSTSPPVDNTLEARFAKFLDKATDVTAWAKLTMNTRFALEYISHAGALRYYYADFVLRLDDDTCLVIETKGQEDLDVALKDRRARRWCRDATRLAGREWAYEKVPQKLFDGFQGDTMDELRRLLDASDGGSGPVPGDEDGTVWP